MDSSGRLRFLHRAAKWAGCVWLAIACGGCEHEERVAKGRAQKTEIQQLQVERDRLDTRRKPYEKSHAKEIAASKEELARNQQILTRLNREIAVQEKTKADLEKASATYRASHPVKNP